MTGLRWGILATGGIARSFTRDLRIAGRNVTAVGSRSREAAQAFADEFAIAHAHGSYEDLVADPEVDIVYIATPQNRHRDDALLALNAGKHVLIEKPVTLDAAEAAEIGAVAQQRGLLAMEAMWTRYLPHMRRIHELLADGALGDVRAMTAEHSQHIPTDPTHRLNRLELGGGALLDLGIYPVSFIWDVLGAPTRVQTSGRLDPSGVDSEIAATMTHASGAVSTMLTSLRARGLNQAHIFGTEARLALESWFFTPTGFQLLDNDDRVLEDFRAPIEGRGMQYQALYAEKLLADGRTDSDLLPFAESIAIMGTLDEIRAQVGVVFPSSAAAPSA